MKRSLIRFALIAPLMALTLVMVWGAHMVAPAYAWSISAECDANGQVVGQIEVPVAGSFDIFVTDHIPGQGYWVEIPGSRETITVVSGKEGLISYGPLDISNARDGINAIRVQQTATPEKSDSFAPCQQLQTPTRTNTATATATKTATSTAIPTNTSVPATATPTVVNRVVTATPTNTAVRTVATPTGTSVINTSTPPVVPTSTPRVVLPNTGTGQGGLGKGQAVFMLISGSVTLGLIGAILIKPSLFARLGNKHRKVN